jgi:hypothetical protein
MKNKFGQKNTLEQNDLMILAVRQLASYDAKHHPLLARNWLKEHTKWCICCDDILNKMDEEDKVKEGK